MDMKNTPKPKSYWVVGSLSYDQKLKRVYIQNDFHHPLAPRRQRLVRDTEHTERNVLMENREVPILHELPGLCSGNLLKAEGFCLSRAILGTNKKAFSP
jgi:hypothetical protein